MEAMNLLLDTHFVPWASGDFARLLETKPVNSLASESELYISAASLRTVIIKCGLDRSGFRMDSCRHKGFGNSR